MGNFRQAVQGNGVFIKKVTVTSIKQMLPQPVPNETPRTIKARTNQNGRRYDGKALYLLKTRVS
jgi:hypothetical protein